VWPEAPNRSPWKNRVAPGESVEFGGYFDGGAMVTMLKNWYAL